MAFKYTCAIVSNLPYSSVSFNENVNFNFDKAREQHFNFVEILRKIGVDVLELEPEEKHPDCAKVGDIAVILNGIALICNPRECHRQGEVNLIRQTLKKELGLRIAEINVVGAFLSGSDVLFTGKEIIVGLSAYTNETGAQSVARAFPEYPTTTITVQNPFKNLKDAISMASINVFAIGQSESARKMLDELMEVVTYSYKQLSLPDDLAAQTIYVNHILVHLSDQMIPNSYGVFENKIDFNRLSLNLSELYKAGIHLPNMALFTGRFQNQKSIVSTLP